ncbi:11925_t:CDS:2 [Diversispora eburnea]|uniref:11925_t:CDS:1 n=1 Tax=Diversispora eburnea TaxID=1213867 RepID=A0A9N8YQG2_9GLOM|nr:11925_t:CDS:2 [Diversispora eburnea]
MNFLDNDNKLFPIILMTSITVASMLLHLVLAHILKSKTGKTGWLFDHAILKYCKVPSFFVFPVSAILLTIPFISDIDSRLLDPIQHVFEILLIIFSTWTAIGFKGEDRKMTTQLLIASRVVTSIIFTLGAACVLSTFPTAWNLGIGLTASAGIIALVIGFAAKQILTNLLVTLQIALTQSILLGDYVVIDDYKGVVEEIQSQYIVLKSIEEKRILVPLSRLIDTTYENWSRTSESLSLDFHLYVDYGIPLDDLKNYFTSEVRKCEHWDQRNAYLTGIDSMKKIISKMEDPVLDDDILNEKS